MSAPTPLEDLLLRRINKTGPIMLSDYMGECLMHPQHGYYASRDPFGQQGDFITAPEISQMFGEMLGLFVAQVWIDQGCPSPITLAELGPGRGTLMADMLRATAQVPGFHAAIDLHMIEASPLLCTLQTERLAPHAITHHDVVQTLPDQPLFLIANEFFDALPIRQFIRDGKMWREHQVGENDGKLQMGLTAPLPQALLDHRLEDTRDGDLVEHCPALGPITEEIATRINTHGGVALVIDYGDWRSLGDTLQALSAHQKTNPLAAPGHADLTAHVDFERIAHFAHPLTHTLLTPQGVFLERLGITDRAQALAEKLQGDALNTHIAAHRRLTHPEEMGTLFKVLGLTRPGAPVLPGLEYPRTEADCPTPLPRNRRPMPTTKHRPLTPIPTAIPDGDHMLLEMLTSDALSSDTPDHASPRHGFFTRKGGASSGVYHGLNCGSGSRDQSELVKINRDRVAAAMEVAPAALCSVYQVHSPDVVTVDGDMHGDRPKADAIVTNTPGLALSILTADCQPVLFADIAAGVIGAAHAGWKGALDGVLENTVQAMVDLGASRTGITAVIGPCISQRNYEVGPEFFDSFTANDPAYDRFFEPGQSDRMMFDLPGFGLHKLHEAGVGRADWVGYCTYADEEKFYSYRRSCHRKEADYGRLISAIRL